MVDFLCAKWDASPSGATTGLEAAPNASTKIALPAQRRSANRCRCGDVRDLVPSGGRERHGAGDVHVEVWSGLPGLVGVRAL